MKKIVVSACLLGENCKYSGGNNFSTAAADYLRGCAVCPVCPEMLGGLPVPRACSERLGERVVTESGGDVTKEFVSGAEAALAVAEAFGAEAALLKARSPSCGAGKIYDGSFTHTLTDGDGVFAALLREKGFPILTEEDLA